MVLLAMAHASNWSTSRIPYEDLVLQAWQDFPAEFSLRNHPEHPDASDIHKRLYQTLRPNGLARTLGNKVFRLTDKGLTEAKRLEGSLQGRPPSTESSRLSREEQAVVEDALASRAIGTWRANEPDKLIDYDARMFFGFSTGTAVRERNIRATFARGAFDKASKLGITGSDELVALADDLMTRFAHLFEEGEGVRNAR
ncbi:MAG TPA: hypothetical protein VH702_15190 [Vicinamibacterales bacterium]|jgi:hypothetical protein